MKAARAFVERGYDATSVNDIAAALGVTKPGLYHYITSKEALFFDIVSLGMDWLDEDVIKPVEGIKDPEERLRQIILRHATLTACNEGWITILLDEMHALPVASGRRSSGASDATWSWCATRFGSSRRPGDCATWTPPSQPWPCSA